MKYEFEIDGQEKTEEPTKEIYFKLSKGDTGAIYLYVNNFAILQFSPGMAVLRLGGIAAADIGIVKDGNRILII